MQAFGLKRSPSTPSSALLGSACLTSSMTHAGVGPENASPPDFDFNMPCRFFKSSFARSLSLNNNNNNSNCNASKSLDYDCNNYHNNANIIISNNNNNNNNNNISVAKTTTTTTNCLPLPKRGAVAATTTTNTTTVALNIAASQNEVSSTATTTTTTTNEVDNHIVNHNHNNNNDNEVNVHDVVCCNEIEVAKLPPALPARRFLAANGNNEQQQQQQQNMQMAQFRTSSSSSSSTSTHINKVINQQQQQQQMSPPSNNNNNNNNTSSAINGNNNQRSYHHHQQQQQQQQQLHYHHSSQQQPQQQQQQQQQHHDCQMWPRDVIVCQQQQDAVSNAEPRPTAVDAAFELHENTLNVEAVILQNQVDTLQWQLKQVETSCEMYRAVMEEVARFLERYTSQRQQQNRNEQQQQQQIARSKSLYHVHGVGSGNNSGGSALDASLSLPSADEASNSYLRARSSTNLINGSGIAGKSMSALSEEHNYEPIAPAGSYNAFKDFTWRRTPKKPNALSAAHALDAGEAKLNQEAFRLARTIHNLLNTQQADLMQRSSLGSHLPGRLSKAASTSVMTLHSVVQAPLHNSTSLTLANGLLDCPPTPRKSNVMAVNTPTLASQSVATVATSAGLPTPEMLFLRANNMRDSRISLRSSTDSSVHSTISSITTSSSASSSSSMKLETDEEGLTLTALKPANNAGGSSTEDESGFSSISSFQDIGIPFSTTLMASTPRNSLKELSNNQLDSRNSTLKAPTASATATPAAAAAATPASAAAQTHPNNVVGLPLPGSVSPSKTYRNAAKYQRFSTLSNEDSATVLWV